MSSLPVKSDQIFGLVIKMLTGFDLIQINIFTPMKYLENFCVSCSMKRYRCNQCLQLFCVL